MHPDQNSTPALDAIRRIRQEGTYTFSLPGHRFGKNVDDRTAEVNSRDTFDADVIMAKVDVGEAEKLFAAAVGAKDAVFTTCGSSISIHTAILTIAGPGQTVLVDRNVHKSVVASLILAGANPIWLRPSWDHERQVAHPATPEIVEQALRDYPDISSVVLITPTEYGTRADVAGIAELCHEYTVPRIRHTAHGRRGVGHPLPVSPGPSDAGRAGGGRPVRAEPGQGRRRPVPVVGHPRRRRPRQHGRPAAVPGLDHQHESLSACLPAVLPGERFNKAVVVYLRAGLAAGLSIPDASDPTPRTFRVFEESLVSMGGPARVVDVD
jgi:arginine/lysine/ornithine decarboxylase